MNRYVVLYLATLIVLVPIDLVFLGLVARGFFAAQVGDMLGEIRPAPAILFYLLYVVGILIFVSASVTATAPSTLLYGALFGFFCYATFELTSLSLLKHWTWPVVIMDVTWGITYHGGLVHARTDDRRLDYAENVSSFIFGRCASNDVRHPGCAIAHRGMTAFEFGAYFGCGTIRIYGFGDFQPCG